MSDDWFDSGGSGKAVDVPALLDSDVPRAIGDIVGMGALVSLGTTRDGGALGITVTVDGRWKREYFRDSVEALSWLAEAVPAVRLAVEALAASAERVPRQRRSRGL
jgi:hypothetical protein